MYFCVVLVLLALRHGDASISPSTIRPDVDDLVQRSLQIRSSLPASMLGLLNGTCSALLNCCLEIESNFLFFVPSLNLTPYFSNCPSNDVRPKRDSCPSLFSVVADLNPLELFSSSWSLLAFVMEPSGWLKLCRPEELFSLVCEPDPTSSLRSCQTKVLNELAKNSDEKVYREIVDEWKLDLKKLGQRLQRPFLF